jgi:hypothetical protein
MRVVLIFLCCFLLLPAWTSDSSENEGEDQSRWPPRRGWDAWRHPADAVGYTAHPAGILSHGFICKGEPAAGLAFAPQGEQCSNCVEPIQGAIITLTNSAGASVTVKTNESGFYVLPYLAVYGHREDVIHWRPPDSGGILFSHIRPYDTSWWLPSSGYTCVSF